MKTSTPIHNAVAGIGICLMALVLFDTGCGRWPEIVDSGKDVAALPVNVTSIRARGLSDDDISSLARLQNLEVLDFGGGHKSVTAKITDRGLGNLARLHLPELDTLTLDHTAITDSGLIEIAKMDTVHWLSLMSCPGVTDQGLSHLVAMTNLALLDLRGCRNVTDSGLTYLKQMPCLREVLLGGCDMVSFAAVAELQAALPKCRVEKNDKEWLDQ